jgi:hypothetical protein
MNIQREISLLDYGGKTDKNVDYRIKENYSGIDLKGFVLTAGEMLEITGESIRDGTIEFTVERVVQYKPWNYGTVTPGSGQMGIYELRASNGKTYFALIKDYRAFEGDWRVMLVMTTRTEREMKDELQVNKLGLSFMDYLFQM